ncbi:HAMP domain-containing sensor histidine kinase [Robbsia sp. Bb-Pol-6]|uniref:histidine kinase n=1 Tax=Robbsia betulipollinis TaxID=2981849 RepID=A0ABT3ZKV8_9BURK|nr:HAMP domain-containing sensor histidine kinase [Robbsia betulipollinis]MCY0386910.1 HAMP domain-containing sensor histidine kinase [Robbsia betulipollinis]
MNDFPQNGHLNLRHLFWLRCLAIAGQVIAMGVACILLGIRLPLLPMSLVILFEVVFNAMTLVRLSRPGQESNRELFGQLCVDLGALTALLLLSGGTLNPFFSLYLPALAIGAAVLPWRLALALTALAVVGCFLLATHALPLVLSEPSNLFELYRTGNWINFLISMALIAWFVARMSRVLRLREAALAEAQQRLLRDERVVALGAQAASIAHEMGSPLSTIALLAEELRESADHDAALAPYRSDFSLLEQQIALCKEALARLQSRAASPNRRRLKPWLESFTEQWRLRHPQAGLETRGTGSDAMAIEDTVAVGQILTILLDNAARASPDHVEFDVSDQPDPAAARISGAAHARLITFRIVDRGPGIPAALRAQVGNMPVRSTQGGAGVGLYLAFVTAARLRGTIELGDASRLGHEAGGEARREAEHASMRADTGAPVSGSGTCAIFTLPATRAEAPDE